MEFVETLFTGGEYWKTVALILLLGAGLAFVLTKTIRGAGLKYYAEKKKPEPWWWSLMLRLVSTFIGGGIGVIADLAMASLDEGAKSSWLLSLLIGLFAGAFCTVLVAIGKMIARKRGVNTDTMNFTWSLDVSEKDLKKLEPKDIKPPESPESDEEP